VKGQGEKGGKEVPRPHAGPLLRISYECKNYTYVYSSHGQTEWDTIYTNTNIQYIHV